MVQTSPEPAEVLERPPKPKKHARPVIAKPNAIPPTENNNLVNTMVLGSSTAPFYPMMSAHQPLPMMQYVPSYSTAANVGNSNSHFETLMSENRTHNSEVRMHLCRLTDKIDLVLQRVGEIMS